MKPLQKVAIFLLIVGFEKGSSIIALMDNREINAVMSEIGNLMEISQEVQESVWTEFEQLGYEDEMNPSEALGVIRLLFTSGAISDSEFFRPSQQRKFPARYGTKTGGNT